MLYIGMALILLSFIGLIGLACIAGLLIGIASRSSSMTWAAFKERLPTFLALAAFLVTLGLLEYGVVRIMQNYGA
jgi:hypothetical protein